MNLIRKWGINMGLMLLSIVFVGGCLEALLRFTPYKSLIVTTSNGIPRYYYKADPVSGYDIRENFHKTAAFIRSERFEYEVWSNGLGCFDTPYTGEKKYVLLVGDSFTHGAAPFKDKWGTLTEKLLGRRILKCGVVGYGSKQELIKAERIIAKVNSPPELILVGYFMNDLGDDYRFPEKAVVNGYLVNTKDIVNVETGELTSISDIDNRFKRWEKYCALYEPEHPFSAMIKCYFERNSILYNIFNDALQGLVLRFPWINDLILKSETLIKSVEPVPSHLNYDDYPWLKRARDDHLKNLMAFKELAGRYGSKLLVVIIPRIYRVYPFLLSGQRMDFEQRTYKMLLEFFQREAIESLDLLPYLKEYADGSPRRWLDSEKDLYWRFDGHWSIKGNHLAGLLVAQHIIENDLLDIADKAEKLSVIKERLKNGDF